MRCNASRGKWACVFAVVVCLVGFSDRESAAVESTKFEPTSKYTNETIEGWTVLGSPRVTRDKSLWLNVREALASDLKRIEHALPPTAVTKLKSIKIWIDENDVIVSGVGYHNARPEPNPAFNPDKVHGVEIDDPRRYLQYTLGQSIVLLHELAHAYHEQFIDGGFSNAELKVAYENAMENKLYDTVLSAEAGERRAYAATDVEEYFAESTESFFATNDFYPFVRAELREHDPKMFELLKNLWGGEPAVATVSDNKLKLTVVNASSNPALVFWSSNDYGDILNHEVKSHESYVISTFVGHHWGAWFFPSDKKEQFTMPAKDATWTIGKQAD